MKMDLRIVRLDVQERNLKSKYYLVIGCPGIKLYKASKKYR